MPYKLITSGHLINRNWKKNSKNKYFVRNFNEALDFFRRIFIGTFKYWQQNHTSSLPIVRHNDVCVCCD